VSRERRTTPRVPSSDRTPEEARRRIEEEWSALADQKRILEKLEADLVTRTPHDVAHAVRVGGVPMPVRLPPKFVQGLVAGFVTLTLTVVGAATAMYYKAGAHIGDAKVHVMEPDGVPTMVKRRYETAVEAQASRQEIVKDVEKEMADQHESLKDELVRVIAPQRYNRWRRAHENRESPN